MGRLEGKVAVVSGAARGMGEAEARLFAREGAAVVVADVLEAEGAAVAKDIGDRAVFEPLDVTDEDAWRRVLEATTDRFGAPDVLVNNAGILGGQSVLEMPLERWNRQLAVNLTGTFLCTKHGARLMVERGTRGSIIVIVSTAGHQGQAGNIGYCTSKSGLLNFTRAAAMDLVRHGIRVNSLTPTATDVAEADGRAVDWGRARPAHGGRVLDFARMLPMDRLPSPRDYASAAVFLASDDARMITGIDLRVDGGAVAKYWPWIPHA
jgi:NAD(P)-dependent dehydrogenase (short-subunit alcohol dehydrogenase family)